jgi:pilus assembly protein CpaF
VVIRDLLRNALRMRPDRIVIGECRGGETLDMLQAMNTGHDGSMTTVHANSARDVISRLETMTLMSGMELPTRAIREQIGAAIHLIVQTARMSDGSRKVTGITELSGMEGERITMQDLFVYTQTGIDPKGKVTGFMNTTGSVPTFLEEFKTRGLTLDMDIFNPRFWKH